MATLISIEPQNIPTSPLFILITLWLNFLDECIPYLSSRPMDTFNSLSEKEGIELLMFLFFSAPVKPEHIQKCLNSYRDDEHLINSLGKLVNVSEIYESCNESMCSDCLKYNRAPTCHECTKKISVALRMFPLLFSRGLRIRKQCSNDENLPPYYSLTENVINWILANNNHIEPVTVRELYHPLLCHYIEQSDELCFLHYLVERIFEDSEKTEYYGNDPLPMEYLDVLLPILDFNDSSMLFKLLTDE